jgi:glycosyltransferase involved in cell wall biosynthesis
VKSTAEILTGMHVLQVVPTLEAGGVEQGTLDVARMLVRVGARASVASWGGRLVGELQQRGGHFHKLPVHSKNPLVMVANIQRLARLIRAENVTLIHARSRAPAWSALAAAWLRKIPFVTTYHGTYSDKSSMKRFYNSVMTRGDIVIANSDFIAAHIRERHHVDDIRLVTIQRGVDLDHFDPSMVSPQRIENFRRFCGIDPDDRRFIILLPGRLTEWKGQNIMIDALARLQKLGASPTRGFLCVCIGDPQGRSGFEAFLKTRIAGLSMQSHMRIVGHFDDMPAAYAGADIVVSPSLEPEAFGRVAIEAQAMMKPIIAADHGGARETVIDGNDNESAMTGLRVPPGDSDALAQALWHLLRLTPEERASIGLRGRRHVEAHFSLVKMCEKTLAVYVWLLSNTRERK